MTKHKRTLTVGFSKPRGAFRQPLSKLIRWFEGCDYSHVYIKLKSENLQNDLFYHASGTEVKFMGSIQFNKHNKTVKEYEHKISHKKYYETLDFAIDRAGAPYSFSQLFGLAFVRIFAILGFRINNPLSDEGYVCTELVAELLEEIYGREINAELNSLTLRDIEYLLNNTKK